MSPTMTTEPIDLATARFAPGEAGPALLAVARLLEYPGSGLPRHIGEAREELDGDALARFEQFAVPFLALAPEVREELYTATFDVTPACVAYVSIHLFGEENFKRGEFMAALHARYAAAGFHPGGELPDHLAVLLRFAAGTDPAEGRELAEFCLLGPLGRMMAALSGENPYRALLETVREVLRQAHPDARPAVSPREQMRQHGTLCAPVSAGCGCGALAGQRPESAATDSPTTTF